MTDNTLIQWPRAKYWDHCWNPIVRCKPCSPACKHCYAAAWAKRFHRSFAPIETRDIRPPHSGVVFCGNMTDLFGEWRGSYKAAFDIVKSLCSGDKSKVEYLWLTKRADVMAQAVSNVVDGMDWSPKFLSNHYFGFTAENQEWHDRRADIMALDFPAWAKKWMSCEPLLGPIDLKFTGLVLGGRSAYDWLVVGCESGPHRRPCKIEWVESIVDQCRAAGVPVFVKQLDIDGKCVTDINKFPAHLRIRQVPWNKENDTNG